MYKPEENRWISILIDALPDFDIPAAERIARELEGAGYHVQRLTADDLAKNARGAIRGSLIVLPKCDMVPVACAKTLQRLVTHGGKLLTLGGPLMYRLVEKTDYEVIPPEELDEEKMTPAELSWARKYYEEQTQGRWVVKEQPDTQMDPSFAENATRVVIEGVSPSYKLYPLTGVTEFETDPLQNVYGGAFRPGAALDMICPIPKMHGIGFGNRRICRYIPIVHAKGETMRGGGRLGASVFITLMESPNNFVGAFGQIGLKDQDVCGLPGGAELLLSMVDRLMNGLFLYEAGANEYSAFPGEDLVIGARVANATGQYAEGEVVFRVLAEGQEILTRRFPAIAGSHACETVKFDFTDIDSRFAEYEIVTELYRDGKKIDWIEQQLPILLSRPATDDQFVTVQGDNFMLGGEPWYPVGVNFWPLYTSGMEQPDYWTGWIDRRYYDPVEIELDLGHMEAMGMNAVSIQLGLNPFEMGIGSLLDFLYRAEKHGVKCSISFQTTTAPTNYNGTAFRELVRRARLAENPTVFAYDIMWEPGNYMFNEEGRKEWDPFWAEWLVERYGSVQRAEQDFGMPVNRDEKGAIVSPPTVEFSEDGPWRIRMAAYRRFMDDLMSRLWRDACQDMRRTDPRHLISYRQGNTLPHDFALTATNKHIDFICPEGYSIKDSEEGYNAACFITRFVDATTGGKPILWFEFGISVNGTVWERLYMDRERMLPPEAKIQAQGSYHSMYYRMVEETMINGTFPWWWPGGYRMDEKSDFGILNADGTLRPASELIVEYAPIIRKPRKRPEPETWVTIDRDAHSGGYWHISFHEGCDAYREAKKAGKWLGVRTEGCGTDSTDTPLVAVGNVPFDGANPPKYLNAEFETFAVLDADGIWRDVEDGDEARVAAGQPVMARIVSGNLREAKWIAPANTDRDGGVYVVSTPDSDLEVSLPIQSDAAYLGDADASGVLCQAPEAPAVVEVHMEARGRARFGEKRRVTLVPV